MNRRALHIAAVAALLAPSGAFAQLRRDTEEEGLSAAQRDEVVEMLEAYLMNNPDVLVKALARSGLTSSGGIEQTLGQASPLARAAFSDPTQGFAPAVGAGGGPQTLVVAFDYACPFCRSLAPLIEGLGTKRPSLKVLLRETPILTTDSFLAGRVGVAVAAQGREKYVTYHFKLMKRRGALNEKAIMDAAAFAGADLGLIASVAGGATSAAALEANKNLMKALGGLATPIMASRGRLVVGAISLDELNGLVLGTPGIGL